MVTYKRECKSISGVPMEPNITVEGYCALYGCSLETAFLPCLFCRNTLSFQDLCAFSTKCLNLVLRNFAFYAACTACLRISAAYEQRHYYQCSTDSCFLEFLCGSHIGLINVRCVHCMKRLDNIEKLDCLNRREKFHLVRGIWRSSCRLCKTL